MVVPYEQRNPATLWNSRPSTAFTMSIFRRLHEYPGFTTGMSDRTTLTETDPAANDTLLPVVPPPVNGRSVTGTAISPAAQSHGQDA